MQRLHTWQKLLAALLVSLFLVVVAPVNTYADFGDFSGDSDYGSSYDDSDYDYSYDDDDDDDYSGSGYFSNFSGGDGGEGDSDVGFGGVILFLIIFILIPWLVIRRMVKGLKKAEKRVSAAQGATPTTDLLPMETIAQWDPDFSAEAITQRLSNLYVQMQNNWTARDITPLRGDFTDAQFAQYDRQLQKYRNDGQTPVVERIAVLGVTLEGVKRSDVHDILIANLSTRITTYTLDDKTGEVVRGSKTDEKFMQYEWTLVRPVGAKTITQSGDDAFNCPNCSAPVKINQSAQCPYCSSVITKGDYDWVIAGIKGLSQRTS